MTRAEMDGLAAGSAVRHARYGSALVEENGGGSVLLRILTERGRKIMFYDGVGNGVLRESDPAALAKKDN